MFEKAFFIKPDIIFNRSYRMKNPAPLFRKKISLDKTERAFLSVCGLGYAYYYINGKRVTEDIFIAPVSDYEKTLWFNTYDVSSLLKKGENVIAVICGNGWFNEEFRTSWNYDEAPWRDVPKCILQLEVDDELVLVTDDTWKCKPESAIVYNALRSGEYFDANLYEENWNSLDYDDSGWSFAVKDEKEIKGIFRECLCEPIREHEVYESVQILQTGERRFVFDVGQNLSGYIRLTVCGNKGDILKIRYAEQLKEDLTLELNGMEKHYFESPFQQDCFICSGKKMTWSPLFVYHGFRYIEIEGIRDVEDIQVQAVFVHQAVRKRTEFRCSDEFLNRLYRAGCMSVWSNMFYMLTDCPTREKLGWTNDAQSSTDQILINFAADKLLKKWMQDIYDAMKKDGSLPGIIPTSGWGYHWGNGPVSDGILFEIPYQLYLHNGDTQTLIDSLPYFKRYLQYLKTREDEYGFIEFGLGDWGNPGRKRDRNRGFINAVLVRNFYQIALLSMELAGEAKAIEYQNEIDRLTDLILLRFIDVNGRCTLDEQTPVAMLIYYGIYNEPRPLAEQLKELIRKKNFHHDCGMVGMRYLYDALNKCGLQEDAYKVLTATGYPSYRSWFDNGATTLWEYWEYEEKRDSKNHHMFSCFMGWMIRTILGINKNANGRLDIAPFFFRELEWVEGSVDTDSGSVSVFWKRKQGNVELEIAVKGLVEITYKDMIIRQGNYHFTEGDQDTYGDS